MSYVFMLRRINIYRVSKEIMKVAYSNKINNFGKRTFQASLIFMKL